MSDFPVDALGDNAGLAQIGLRQQNGELVATEAGDDIRRALALHANRRHEFERLIAGLMPKTVVDVFEQVDVDENQ